MEYGTYSIQYNLNFQEGFVFYSHEARYGPVWENFNYVIVFGFRKLRHHNIGTGRNFPHSL